MASPDYVNDALKLAEDGAAQHLEELDDRINRQLDALSKLLDSRKSVAARLMALREEIVRRRSAPSAATVNLDLRHC
jgi:Arc/MetJ-type ribon-helix-helix transcriptional regulator